MESKTLLNYQKTDGKNLLYFLVNCDKKGQQNQTKAYLKSRLALLESYWVNIFNTDCCASMKICWRRRSTPRRRSISSMRRFMLK